MQSATTMIGNTLQQGRKYPTIKVCAFTYGDLVPATHETLLRECMYAISKNVTIKYDGRAGGALIDKARSAAMFKWWQHGEEDIMCMVDHDMDFKAGDLIETARLAYEHQVPVGGMYSKKSFGLGFACCDGEIDKDLTIGIGDHRVEKMTRLGGGFMCIPRNVPNILWQKLNIESEPWKKRMRRAMERGSINQCIRLTNLAIRLIQPGNKEQPGENVDFFRQFVGQNSKGIWNWFGEDFSFCERCVDCGIIPQINTAIGPRHWGPWPFSIHDAGRKWPPEAKHDENNPFGK